MAETGIIYRRDSKANLILDPPIIGEVVFALDTEEYGAIEAGGLVWRLHQHESFGQAEADELYQPIDENIVSDADYVHTDNNFTTPEMEKLLSVQEHATQDMTPIEILTAIKTVDGTGSGLDADRLDGLDSGQFLRKDEDATHNTNLTVIGDLTAGDVVTDGLVDGRDVSVDGAKLDTFNLGDLNVSNKIGNPIHIDTYDEVYNHFYSSGIMHGCTLTNNGDGTINLDAGFATIRANGDTGHGTLYSAEIPAINNLALTNNATNYVYVSYNDGITLSWEVSNTPNTVNMIDKLPAFIVVREDDKLTYLDARSQNVDHIAKNQIKEFYTAPFTRKNGGSIVQDAGTLHLECTSGAFYFQLNEYIVPALDTTGADTFEQYKHVAGEWFESDEQTFDNVNYDDGTDLVAIGLQKYGVHWIYVVMGDVSHYAVVYGTQQYANVADAQASTAPSSLPPSVAGLGILLGRAIFQRSYAELTEVSSAFTTTFTPTVATNHEGLAGIQGGAVGDHIHLTTAEKAKIDFISITQDVDLDTIETDLNGVIAGTTDITYDGTVSGLSSTTVKTAIDENNLDLDNVIGGTTDITFDNAVSGLTATTVKTAIDEIDATINSLEAGTTALPGNTSTDFNANNVVIQGTLTVNGTTTTVNAETILLADNIITLNSNETLAPTQNGGIEIERGTSTNVDLRWNESSDKWEVTEDGATWYEILTTGDGTLDAIALNTDKITNVTTNLSATSSGSSVYILSSDGTDAELTTANTVEAGIMTSDMFDEHVVNNSKVSDINHNVSTNLSTTHNASSVVVNSSDGTNATINTATATTAGVMSEAIYDEHVLNNAKETNVSTNLSTSTTASTVAVNSSDGNNASIGAATTNDAGIMTSTIFDEHTTNNTKVTNVTTNLTADASGTNVYVNSSDGSNATISPVNVVEAGIMTSDMFAEHTANNNKVSDINHNVSTNLSIGTRNTSTTNINSSDGTNATIPAATQSLSGLMTGADKLKLDNSSSSTGTVSSVTAGTGMTQTGTSTINPTLNVIGSTGITANADNIALTPISAGDGGVGALKYNGITVEAGTLNGGTTEPTNTDRLNYEGIFYPTGLNLSGSADTSSTSTHYFVETGVAGGKVEPKTLANVKTELVTSAAVTSGLGFTPLASNANAVSATKWATARTFDIIGDVTGTGVSFDGSANVTFTAVVGNDTHSHTGSTISALDGTDITTGTIADARLPATITSNITGSSASCTGNSATANKLTTARTIDITGDITATAVAFDGSANIAISASVNNASHTHTVANLSDSTVTATELNYVVGVTSAIQTQLNDKQASGTYNTIIGTDTDINTSGSTIVDNIFVTDGVITSMGTRVLTTGDIGAASLAGSLSQDFSVDTLTADNGLTVTGGRIAVTAVATNNSLDFTKNNLTLTATAANITVGTAPVAGQSGTIRIASANLIEGWTGFTFKTVPTGLTGTEVFAYWAESSSVIYIGLVK